MLVLFLAVLPAVCSLSTECPLPLVLRVHRASSWAALGTLARCLSAAANPKVRGGANHGLPLDVPFWTAPGIFFPSTTSGILLDAALRTLVPVRTCFFGTSCPGAVRCFLGTGPEKTMRPEKRSDQHGEPNDGMYGPRSLMGSAQAPSQDKQGVLGLFLILFRGIGHKEYWGFAKSFEGGDK